MTDAVIFLSVKFRVNRAYIVQIADFGLARDMDDDGDYYIAKNQERPMPIKWMAIEALRDQKWSVMSDVVSRIMKYSLFNSV